MNQPLTFKTITQISQAEFKDRGSKFIAYAFPVNSIDEIKKIQKQLKDQHPKAVHHCLAWRLGTSQNQFRASDDGEPSGSAGKPILGQIDSSSLTNILIIVVRYFGGVLLGVPGLIQAYKTASLLAIANNYIVDKNIEKLYLLEFDYTYMNEVMRVLKQQSVNVLQQEMLLFCTIKIGIALASLDETLSKLNSLHNLTIKELS